MADAPARASPAVLAAFLATVLFLGSNFVAVRLSNRELDPAWGGALRFMVASLLLFYIATLRGIPLPTGPALRGAHFYGLLAFGVNFGLLYWALVQVPAGIASVVFATIPLTTFILAVALRLERFRFAGLVGALVVVAGVVVVSWAGLRANVPLVPLSGIVVASAAAALSGIVVKRFPPSHPIAMNAVAMASGAVVLLGLAVARQERFALPATMATWLALGYLVASSVIAFGLMVWVIRRWSASAAAYGAVLAPLVTLPLAAWLTGEAVSPLFLAGAVLVLGGVYIGALRRHRPPTPPTVPPQAPPSTPKGPP